MYFHLFFIIKWELPEHTLQKKVYDVLEFSNVRFFSILIPLKGAVLTGKDMEFNRRILVVDDNDAIHKDVDAILGKSQKSYESDLLDMESELFGDTDTLVEEAVTYYIDHAYSGEEAIEAVKKASGEGNPYSLVFMDVRMPSGIDGIEAIAQIWERFPQTEMVICTAYSDFSWTEIQRKLGHTDHLLFMKKPFDATALRQTALSLTTKWKLQQEAIRYTENLEQKVRIRTRELDEIILKFKEMKEKAEKASEAKSEFLANVSHEIRTPMNGIIGMNSLLMETDLTDEQKELSNMVKYSADSLMVIINDILDFSKIEAGKMDIESIPFSLKRVADNIEKVLGMSAKGKDLKVTLNYDESIPEVLLGDPTRLRQVLLNFGNNAIKFTEEGSVELSVRSVQDKKGSVKLRLQVKDTGVGIEEEHQESLFMPFSQGDSSTSRRYGGTGLGLAICNKIASLMNGEVGFESEAGTGSTFWFDVELQKDMNQPGPEDQLKAEKGDAEKTKAAQDLKILVAEDNKINQKVIRMTLEKQGFKIDIASTGIEVLEMYNQKEYDIIFMDVHMPEMDGFDATREIRAIEQEKGGHTPIVAFTASVMQHEKDLCIESGMDDFIGKPIEKEELISVLSRWAKDQTQQKGS